MKKWAGLITGLVLGVITISASGQEWVKSLPQESLNNGEVSFFEIKEAFNEYWAPKNVENGYYQVNGERVKATGWKQFKRWEWFWESRVDPATGMFPETSAFFELQRYREEQPALKSGTQSGNWQPMGPYISNGGYSGIGRVNSVAFHPADNSTYYAGSAGGGLWKTSDGGVSWIPLSDDIGALGVSDIVVLENGGSETIYIATGDKDAADNYSVGVLKSTDGGLSWSTTGLNWAQNYYRRINRLLVDPGNPEILYAASSYGLYKTVNGGLSWSNISSLHFADIEFRPGSPNVIYGSTKSGGEIHRSLDSGQSWSLIIDTNGSRGELAVSQDDPNIVYCLIGNSSTLNGIYKSTDGGSGFSMIHGSVPNLLDYRCDGSGTSGQAWYDLCIAADPTDANKVYIGGINTWGSYDGGQNWDIKNMWSGTCGGGAQEVHADKHNLAFQNGGPVLFECNDGGLYRSDDYGQSWDDLSNGMVISQMYRLGVAQTHANDIITGLQDNGTKHYYQGAWKDYIGGDGMECAIDPTNNQIQYGSLYYGAIYRTTNHWASRTNIATQFGQSGAWITPFLLDPQDPSIVYVGFQDVWMRNFDADQGWIRLSNFGSTTDLRFLAVAPSNTDVICAATLTNIYRTSDGGQSWINIPRPANASVSGVHIDDQDPQHFWVSFSQFNSYGVFETFDGGNSWIDISAGLPAIPVNCVIKNTQNTRETELYAGTDLGVYLKYGSNDWVLFSEGLPNVVITDLEIYYASDPAGSKIRAATYGRGVWESDLYEGPVVNNITFNNDPIILADATEDAAFNGSLAGYVDYSGTQDLTYSKLSGPAWLVIEPGTGVLSGMPVNEDVGQNTFTVKVDAGTDGNDQAQLSINVKNTNDNPIFTADPINGADANEADPYNGTLAGFAEDPDGDILLFAKLTGPDWLQVSADGSLGGTPGIGDRDANQWTIQVSDGNGGTDNATLNIFVYPINHPPAFNTDPVIKADALEDSNYSASLAGDVADLDEDNLTFNKVSGPQWLVIAADGSLSGTPVQADVQQNQFVVSVNDSKGGTDEASLIIDVVNVNDPPVWTNDPVNRPDAMMEQAYSASLAGEASDEDGDQLSYTITGPAWLTCSVAGELTGIPSAADVGTNSWVISVTDGTATDAASLVINVLFVNHPPEFNTDPIDGSLAYEDQSYNDNISSYAGDADGDPLSFSKLSGPDWLIVGIDGAISGIPSQSDVGINSFTVTVSDGSASDNAVLNIQVENTNDPPVFSSGTLNGPEAVIGEFSSGSLAGTATDSDGDELFYSISGPAWLSISADGYYSGTPQSADQGLNLWTVTVNDGNNGTASAILEINVIQAAQYCDPGTWLNTSEWINSVVFNGTGFSTGKDANGYGDHSDQSFQIEVNSLVNFTLSPGYSGRSSFVFWNIWIDYDKNGRFEGAGELVYSSSKNKNDLADIFTLSGDPMTTRMRISVSDSEGAMGCDDFRNGEVEDYTIDIITSGPKPPDADFTADQTSISPGTTVNFSDLSINDPTTWAWTFGNGKSSNAQHPAITFDNAGTFTVTLTAANQYGSDILTRDQYIVVSDNTAGNYCEPTGINNSLDYIKSVNIEGVASSTGQGDYGYYHYLSPVFDLLIGNANNIALEPFNPKNRNFWRVWIDFNSDGDFDDSDETLLVGNNKKGGFSDVISIPSYVAPGKTRMRISMETGSSPASCDDFFEGEVEDYDVNLTPGTFIGIREPGMEDGLNKLIKIFPNPVNDILTVQAKLADGQSRIWIYNLLGQEMLWLPVLSDYTEIDVKTFEKGIYFLVFQNENGNTVEKFVKD